MQARVDAVLTRGHVELPAMPGAGDDAAGQFALGQRATGVRTDAVEREEPVLDMKQCDDAAPDDELAPFTNRHIGDRGHSQTMSHRNQVSARKRTAPHCAFATSTA